ncbi:MAG TPA: permease [bacterium]|nr:permease [bacterium]HPN29933.1 permease [bacterium]
MDNFKKLSMLLLIFLAAYFIPFDNIKVQKAILESFYMLQDYAQKHVLLCLVPAFFIAGGISVFVSQSSVMKYLGAGANKLVAYTVASVSGTILAVCSCTVLPLFSGIYKMGAGLGPASAFLYSGPAINVLAIVLTAKILGWQIGLARAVGAIAFAFIIGLLMAFTFRNEENEKKRMKIFTGEVELKRTLLQDSIYFFAMVAILVFANLPKPDIESGIWWNIFSAKWYLTGAAALLFGFAFIKWFKAKAAPLIITAILSIIAALIFPQYPLLSFSIGIAGVVLTGKISNDDTRNWLESTWTFALQILPLLFGGVLVAGFLLGMPGTNNGIIPNEWIGKLVGGNSLLSNFFAALVGAFMYFATLTEVPIIQGLIGSGMGQGPALALLLAGPALSLPNMIVINNALGFKKTFAFISYVIILSTLLGYVFGKII